MFFSNTGDQIQFSLPKKIEWYIKIFSLKCLQLKQMAAIFNLCVKYWSNYLWDTRKTFSTPNHTLTINYTYLDGICFLFQKWRKRQPYWIWGCNIGHKLELISCPKITWKGNVTHNNWPKLKLDAPIIFFNKVKTVAIFDLWVNVGQITYKQKNRKWIYRPKII